MGATDGGDVGDRQGRRWGLALMYDTKWVTDWGDRLGRRWRPIRATDGAGSDIPFDRFGRPTGATMATDSGDRRGRCEQLTRPTATDGHRARFSDGVGGCAAGRFQGDGGDRWGRRGGVCRFPCDRRGRPMGATDGGDHWQQAFGGVAHAAGTQPLPMATGRRGGRGDAAKMPARRQTIAAREIEQARAGMQAGCGIWPSRGRADVTKSQYGA